MSDPTNKPQDEPIADAAQAASEADVRTDADAAAEVCASADAAQTVSGGAEQADVAGAAGSETASDAQSSDDELTRAEERLHAVEAELEAARARVAELRRDASYPQPPLSAEGGAAAAEDPAAVPGGSADASSSFISNPAPYEPPAYSAFQQPQQAYAQQPYGAPHGAAQQFGQPYGQPQQPYSAPRQPYGQQPFGAYQQPYGAPQQPYANAPYTPPSYAQPVVTKDHVAAGLLAIFLGVFGVHKFYLGYNTSGFIMLAVTILGSIFTIGLAAGVMWVIALIEGIIYLAKSQSEFDAIYVANKKEWF